MDVGNSESLSSCFIDLVQCLRNDVSNESAKINSQVAKIFIFLQRFWNFQSLSKSLQFWAEKKAFQMLLLKHHNIGLDNGEGAPSHLNGNLADPKCFSSLFELLLETNNYEECVEYLIVDSSLNDSNFITPDIFTDFEDIIKKASFTDENDIRFIQIQQMKFVKQ